MSEEKVLLSSAYFPPYHYFALIQRYRDVLIENQENYIKQTWRNRCRICSSNGPMNLSVPVLEGSFHKIPFSKVRIDYTKRWQQVHLGALEASYRAAPFFEFYYDKIREVINARYEFLWELNLHSMNTVCGILKLNASLELTDIFNREPYVPGDFRYSLSPKKGVPESTFRKKSYSQVFSDRFGFIPWLSILDLLFNEGPFSLKYLELVVKEP